MWRAGRRVGTDLGDPSVLDHQRAGREDAVGQHQRGARQDDHGSAAVTRRAAPMAAASRPAWRSRSSAHPSSASAGAARSRSGSARASRSAAGRHDAAEHEHLGIGDRDQVRRRHARDTWRCRGRPKSRRRRRRARRSSTCSTVIADRSSLTMSCTRDRSPALMRQIRRRTMPAAATSASRAAGLPVVLALDRVERQPRDRPGAPARTGDRSAVADDAACRVLADGEKTDVLHAARRADPRFRRGGRRSRRHRAAVR